MRKKELRAKIAEQMEGLKSCFKHNRELQRGIILWHSKWVKLGNYLDSFGELVRVSELSEKMKEIQNED